MGGCRDLGLQVEAQVDGRERPGGRAERTPALAEVDERIEDGLDPKVVRVAREPQELVQGGF